MQTNCKQWKSVKIDPNQVLMVRFDAESPQESESDPESTRRSNLNPNKAKHRFRQIVDLIAKCVFALTEALLNPISIRIEHRGATNFSYMLPPPGVDWA